MINRRKKLFVDRPLQLQLIGIVLACGAFTSLTLTLGLNLLSSHVLEVLRSSGTNPETQAQVSQEFNQAFVQFLLLTLVSLGWAWILSLYLTHRILGPLQNIMRTLDYYLNGETSIRVHLRKGDHYQALGEKINKVLESK